MHQPLRFFAVIFFSALLPNMFLFAQVPTTNGDLKLQMKDLTKQVDSLSKEAKHLQDSLFGPGMHGWTKDYDLKIPNRPEYRFFERMPFQKIKPFKEEEKKEDEMKNPIRDFKGWYYEKLADK